MVDTGDDDTDSDDEGCRGVCCPCRPCCDSDSDSDSYFSDDVSLVVSCDGFAESGGVMGKGCRELELL